MNAQLVLSKEDNLESIQINQLQSGIYLLKVYTENAQKMIKIAKKWKIIF